MIKGIEGELYSHLERQPHTFNFSQNQQRYYQEKKLTLLRGLNLGICQNKQI